VPVRFVDDDENPEIKRGNVYMAILNKFVEVTCGKDIPIPGGIECSLRDAKVKDIIRAKDLKLPTGVHLSSKFDPDIVLAVIQAG